MPRWRWLSLPLAATACVTVTQTTVRFPVREDWRSCVRERLEGLGYAVAQADSATRELSARRGRLHLTAVVDSAAILQLTAAQLPLSDVDSLSIYCGGIEK